MNIETFNDQGTSIAHVCSETILIQDVVSALDLMATVQYETGCSRIALDKRVITEDFFRLRTKLAGDILQKFINYRVKLAIYGDFSGYSSKALRDFMIEANSGKDVFFVDTLKTAIEKLGNVK